MKRPLLYLFIIFSFFFILLGEDTVDEKIANLKKKLEVVSNKEKIKVLNELAFIYINSSYSQSIKFGNQALLLANELNDKEGEADAIRNIGIANTEKGEYNKALESFKIQLKICQSINSPAKIARSMNDLGIIYRRQGNSKIALEYFMEAWEYRKEKGTNAEKAAVLQNIGLVYEDMGEFQRSLDYNLKSLFLKESMGNQIKIADSYQNIGNLYLNLEKYTKALEFYNKSLKIYKETGSKTYIPDILISIGSAYIEMEKYKNALKVLKKSLKLSKDIDAQQGISYSLINIGLVFEKTKEYQKALEYYNESLKILRKIGAKRASIECNIFIGRIYLKLNNDNKAYMFLMKGLNQAKEFQFKSLILNANQYLSDYYLEKKQYKEALVYFRQFHDLDKEIFNEKSDRQISNMQAIYESEKRTKEIEMLKKNNEIQVLKLSKSKLTRNALIVSLLLVIIILGLLFRKYLYLFAFWKRQKYIGQFRLVEKINSGGMGTIYKAQSVRDKSHVAAIKILKEEFFPDEINKKRFKQEAVIIDKLEHPNIVRISERGEFQQTLYSVMEYLEGETLEERILEHGQLNINDSLHIMSQVVDVLAYIHGKNIIHRDIKPANIMLIQKEGDPNFVKLLDFGLARFEYASRLTLSGDIIGTIQYVAPEQIQNAQSLMANDIFSLGVTFYRMLSGRNAFDGETVVKILSEILTQDPPAISEYRPNIPDQLESLVMKMLNKNPDSRPTAESIKIELQKLIQDN